MVPPLFDLAEGLRALTQPEVRGWSRRDLRGPTDHPRARAPLVISVIKSPSIRVARGTRVPEGLLVLWAPHQAGARRAAGALGPAPGRTGQPPRKLIPRASKQVSRPSECFPEPRSDTLPNFSACTPFITLLFFDRASRSAFGLSPNPVRAPLVARLLAIRAFFDRRPTSTRSEGGGLPAVG